MTNEHFSAKSKATSGTLTISLTVSEITTYFEKMSKLVIFANLANLENLQSVELLHMITLVIPNFSPFRSIYYCFRDNNFSWKNGKIDKFGQFGKILILFSNYGPLHIITLVIPNFRLFCSISHRFWDSDFWPKKFPPNF